MSKSDASGDKVYFKEPYYDRILKKTFKSASEKSSYMKANDICSTGDTQHKADREKKQYHEKRMDTDKEYKKSHERR